MSQSDKIDGSSATFVHDLRVPDVDDEKKTNCALLDEFLDIYGQQPQQMPSNITTSRRLRFKVNTNGSQRLPFGRPPMSSIQLQLQSYYWNDQNNSLNNPQSRNHGEDRKRRCPLPEASSEVLNGSFNSSSKRLCRGSNSTGSGGGDMDVA